MDARMSEAADSGDEELRLDDVTEDAKRLSGGCDTVPHTWNSRRTIQDYDGEPDDHL